LSEAGEELINVIRESYLDAEFESNWRPAKIQLINNKSLQTTYEGLFATYFFNCCHIITVRHC